MSKTNVDLDFLKFYAHQNCISLLDYIISNVCYSCDDTCDSCSIADLIDDLKEFDHFLKG